MSSKSYVVFELGHSCYGVAATSVQELFAVPLIIPITEFSSDLLGVIHWRGEILPILNLHRRLGLKMPPLEMSDSVIVLQWQNQSIGIVVNQVHDVWTIEAEQISDHLFEKQTEHSLNSRLVDGIVKNEEAVISLLNHQRIVGCLNYIRQSLDSLGNPLNQLPDASDIAQTLVAHLDDLAQDLLRERAENLRQITETQETVGQLPFAVMGLEGEYFGFSLETVHEFTDIRKVTPIPCCPSHIIGNMNLRGEIITLVDIGRLIHLKTAERKERKKAIVVRLNDITAAVVADEIFDVVYVQPEKILAAPVAVHLIKDEYLQGVTSYEEKMMSIIYLAKILASEELVVNETVSAG